MGIHRISSIPDFSVDFLLSAWSKLISVLFFYTQYSLDCAFLSFTGPCPHMPGLKFPADSEQSTSSGDQHKVQVRERQPVTWQTLVDVLRDCDVNTLVKQL